MSNVIVPVLLSIIIVATFAVLYWTLRRCDREAFEDSCQTRPRQSHTRQDDIIGITNTVPDSSYVVYNPNYEGSYMKVNEDIPGTSTRKRGEAINHKIAAMCENNKQINGVNPYDSELWSPYRYKTTSGTERVYWEKDEPVYGGPCLWCAKGQGMFIPHSVPLPYDGSLGGQQGATGVVGCPNTLADRIQKKTLVLGRDMEINPMFTCDSHIYDNDQIVYSLQPNGGFQFAFRPKDTVNRIHIVYLDNTFNRCAPDIVVEALDIGGIAALDNGTIALLAQHDCDGATTPDANHSNAMKKPVIVCWRNGSLQWATRLTDPWRNFHYNDSEMSIYKQYPEGWGDYIGAKFGSFAHMMYDSATATTGVFFRLGSGEGHWWSMFVKVDSAGNPVSRGPGCGHDMGGRVVVAPNGDFNYICNDDGWGMYQSARHKQIVREMKEYAPGYSSARLGTFIKKKRNDGFFIAYSSRTWDYTLDPRALNADPDRGESISIPDEQPVANIYILELDSEMVTKRRIPYFGNTYDSNTDHYNVHLVPYGSADDVYLLHFVRANCTAKTSTFNYQIIRFNGSGFVPVTPLETISDIYIPMGSDPQVCRNGDLLWMFRKTDPNDRSLVVAIMKSC